MWSKITEIVKTATSMLQAGKVPPNTPEKHQEDMSKINFLASRKFFIVFCSVILLSFFYLISIAVLFLTSFFPAIIVPFVTIFSKTMEILALIVSTFLGIQVISDFSFRSSSSTDLRGENINSNKTIESNSNQNITQDINETIDDSRSRPDYEEEK